VREAKNNSSVDWELVLRRMKSFLVDESQLSKAEKLVERESIWKQLPPDKAIEWAEVAQALGKPELSLRVLEWVLQNNPGFVPALEAKTKLLESLIIRSVSDQGSDKYSDDDSDSLPSSLPVRVPESDDSQVEKVAHSFLKFRKMAHLVANYMNIFRGREDCFARQWVDRDRGTHGYMPVRRPMTEEDVLAHLEGKQTYGIYLLHSDDRVSLGVIDVDVKSDFLKGSISQEDRKRFKSENIYLLRRIPELAQSKGIPCFGEFSGGKGYHFWFSFETPVPAEKVRRVLLPLAKHISGDLTCFKLEVFPKQDRASGKGFGNLVKLPLGIHRVTGKPSFFIHQKDRSLEAQLSWLTQAPRIKAEAIEGAMAVLETSIMVRPSDEDWAKNFPELAVLSSKCIVLGNLISQCRTGRSISLREEKVLFGTIAFLPRGSLLIHYLLKNSPDYNLHLVDYKISRVRGSPLGCKTIHRLLDAGGDFCIFENVDEYSHPLLHLPEWKELKDRVLPISERVENLRDALEFLKRAIITVERFLPNKGSERG